MSDVPEDFEMSDAFRAAWAKKEAAGYRYGGDALENVRFGFEIAEEELLTLEVARKIVEAACRCGSGGHPRKCEAHPKAYDAHIFDLQEESKLITRIEDLEEELLVLRAARDEACDLARLLAWSLHRECPNDLDETAHPNTLKRIEALRVAETKCV